LYVGFPKKGRKIDFNSRIHSPFRVSRKKAEQQITLLSDYLVLEAVSVLKGYQGLDFEDLEGGMTYDYIIYLRRLWPIMTKAHRRKYTQMMRLPDQDAD
jgi:hypothetical protein